MTGAARALQAALLDAHRTDDRRGLVSLYAEAADMARNQGDTDRECFFLTHAYIFALETGHERRGELYARLKAEGREA